MTTQEIADRLVELYNQGKPTDAEKELYAKDSVSHEQSGLTVTGLDGIIEKTSGASNYYEEVYKNEAEKALVNQDTFLIKFNSDVKPKNGERSQGSEYGFYKVADGKIVEEYFYAA